MNLYTDPTGNSFTDRLKRVWSAHPLALVLSVLVCVIILLGIALMFRSCGTPKIKPSSVPQLDAIARLDSIVLRPQNKMYGLPVDDFDIQFGQIDKGETFSRLLNQRFSVNMSTVNRLIELSKGKFDLARDIRAGNNYTVFLTPDSTETLCYLVYEKNATEYVTFGLCDSVYVQIDRKNVTTEERYAEGVINSSLYATMYETGLNPMLADRMADIYQWTIDFHALQKGDHFRVVYEERFIDTLSVGIGDIYGIEFVQAGKSIWAFRFTQDDERGYWDDKGVNLRKAMLLTPLKYNARVTSKFGMRNHPIRRIRVAHNGVDYACPVGTPVHSVADGVVSRRGWDSKGGGNFIWIRHANGFESGYLHLSKFEVKQGERVRQGQLIARSGNTGSSTGPHLDYRLKKDGKFVDPLRNTSAPATPVKPANKAAFDKMQQDVMRVMESYRAKK